MSQNTSHAVMAQRSEPNDSLDHFPTPPWATRALCEWINDQSPRPRLSEMSAWEPACAEGHMARPLSEYFESVISSDVHDYGFGEVADFLSPSDQRADWIITNPPFRLAEQFASLAFERSNNGCAMLVRTAFLESAGRYARLFSKNRPCDILQFVERVPIYKGRLVENGTTATAYCWIVWSSWAKETSRQTRFHWLAPCRKRLERSSDYDEAAE